MKSRTLWIAVGVTIVAIIATVVYYQTPDRKMGPADTTVAHSPLTEASPKTLDPRQVPAHFEVAPVAKDLGEVLPSSRFTGKIREAYEAVKLIPVTIAQLPCYCHCDRGMGHKSLHSCFEDDHAAHCATCVDEALMAYRLQKDGLSPAQIRERIVAQYSGS